MRTNLLWLLYFGVSIVFFWRILPAWFERRHERLHRLAGGVKYPECMCIGCWSRHELAAHGFASTKEAFSWKRALQTNFNNTWHETPLRSVAGCHCTQCRRLLREEREERVRQRDEREAIAIKVSPPPPPEWMAGGWS
jgi:hypothetical protein